MDPEFSITDIDRHIATAQKSLSLFPRWDHTHINSLHILAKVRFVHYLLSQQKEDLDMSILHHTEAILLPPIPRARSSLHLFQLLYNLASALLDRSEDFEQPEDVWYSIGYLQYPRGLPLNSFDVSRNDVTTSLIQALAVQVELGADFPFDAFESLNEALNAEYNRERPIPLLGEVIECLRDAVKVCPPGSYELLFALADQLFTCFVGTHSNDDYEDAIAFLERILDTNQPGECPDSIRGKASELATVLALIRSVVFENPEHSEVAISRLRALLNSPFINEGLRFRVTESLSILVGERFRNYRLAEMLQEADSYRSQVVSLSSVRNLGTALQHSSRDLTLQIPHQWTCGLSVEYSRLLLNASHPSDPWRMSPLSSLRDILHLAFKKTSKFHYLDESIILGYDILKLKGAQHGHFDATQWLVVSLFTRWQFLGRREDIHEAIRLMSLAIDNQPTLDPGLRCHRFAHFACHGNLETGKPFDASFQLNGEERPTLLDIVRSRLPNTEFESITDEALYLTSAMQYCGFRSVAGTMWAMADTDGRDLAANLYKSLSRVESRVCQTMSDLRERYGTLHGS